MSHARAKTASRFPDYLERYLLFAALVLVAYTMSVLAYQKAHENHTDDAWKMLIALVFASLGAALTLFVVIPIRCTRGKTRAFFALHSIAMLFFIGTTATAFVTLEDFEPTTSRNYSFVSGILFMSIFILGMTWHTDDAK